MSDSNNYEIKSAGVTLQFRLLIPVFRNLFVIFYSDIGHQTKLDFNSRG